jgi:hypothetical protein
VLPVVNECYIAPGAARRARSRPSARPLPAECLDSAVPNGRLELSSA